MDESLHTGSLAGAFRSAAARFPDRPAIEVDGRSVSYAELEQRAVELAAVLRGRPGLEAAPGMVAILGGRGLTTYAAILGALAAGHAYVPLNPAFPSARLRAMLDRSGAAFVVADRESAPLLRRVLGAGSPCRLVVFPEGPSAVEADGLPERVAVIGPAEMRARAVGESPALAAGGLAYLLYTSGSTGEPKGVAVSQASVLEYLRTMRGRLEVTERDRFSQLFELGFDLSVSDLFLPWSCGACVCVPSSHDLVKPDRYVADSALTVWFSTPSHAALMRRLGVLKPGRYPGIRASLFCGEALPVETARSWALACPYSSIDNLYGPTEATIACTAHRWDPDLSPVLAVNGIVPIGRPFPGTEVLLADEELREVRPGESGELLLGGRQLAPGYWRDPQRTAASFVSVPGRGGRWYRTGDRVRFSAAGELVFLGRRDEQVKVRGFRVELGEIEAAAREDDRVRAAAAVPWPAEAGGAEGIALFVEGDGVDASALRLRLASALPPYMVPRSIRLLPRLPVNDRGKCDRVALARMLHQSP